MTTKFVPINFLSVLTLVGDSTISKDFFLDFGVDLALTLVFAFNLAFALVLDLTGVLATTSPNEPTLLTQYHKFQNKSYIFLVSLQDYLVNSGYSDG